MEHSAGVIVLQARMDGHGREALRGPGDDHILGVWSPRKGAVDRGHCGEVCGHVLLELLVRRCYVEEVDCPDFSTIDHNESRCKPHSPGLLWQKGCEIGRLSAAEYIEHWICNFHLLCSTSSVLTVVSRTIIDVIEGVKELKIVRRNQDSKLRCRDGESMKLEEGSVW